MNDLPQRVVDGVVCTNRAGIAHLAGWAPGHSVNVRAANDPEFPSPLLKIGREYWYPIEGDNGVDAYLDILAARAAAKKPPTVEPGNPWELLDPAGVARALGIEESTVRSYVRRSKRYWDGREEGQPILPKPDKVSQGTREDGSTYTLREWYRGTLAAHQPHRPGPGGGRPPKKRPTQKF